MISLYEFLRLMSEPRVGWLSVLGLLALAFMAGATMKYLIGDASMGTLLVSVMINLVTLTMDYMRNATR